jgi:hypothetical protein
VCSVAAGSSKDKSNLLDGGSDCGDGCKCQRGFPAAELAGEGGIGVRQSWMLGWRSRFKLDDRGHDREKEMQES